MLSSRAFTIILVAVLLLSTAGYLECEEKIHIIDVDIVKFIKQNRPTAHKRISDEMELKLLRPLMLLARTQREFNSNTPKEIAIDLLGDLRVADSEVVRTLVKDIDFFPPGFDHALESPIMDFPCARALIKIGRPSIDAIFDFDQYGRRIEDKHLILYAWVISHIDGDEVGKHRIELEIKKAAKNLLRKRNLQELLKVYETKKKFFDVKEFAAASESLRNKKKPKKNESRKRPKEVVKEKPIQEQPKVEPEQEPTQFESQHVPDWLVLVLVVIIIVQAGAIVFLLLRRKK